MNRFALRAALPFSPVAYAPPFDPAYFGTLRPALHDYQDDLLDRLVAAIMLGYTRILLQLATGGGKTHIAKAIIGATDTAHFVVHRKELIEQTSRTFWDGKIRHGFVAAGKPADEMDVLLCGIATLVNRQSGLKPPAIVIIDECHHAAAATWAQVINDYPPDTIIIGLTATPQRLDGRGLDEFFQIMLCGPDTAELIRRGFLSPYDYYAPSLPDMRTVRTDQDAEAIMDKPQLIGDMVEHYLRLARGQPGIVFAHSVEHSRHLVDAYQAHGVRAAHIDGDMTSKERERIDEAFRAREFDVLSNCSLLGEGYDVPGIVYCGIGRRTKSMAWYRQMVGRALRMFPGKGRAILCDHAANVFFHGLPDDPYEWSLLGRAARAAAGCNDDAIPVRQCQVCFRVSYSTAKVCPGCETDFPAQRRRIEMTAGELRLFDAESRAAAEEARQQAMRQRQREEKACKTWADFKRLAEQRGYDDPGKWATVRMNTRSRAAARWSR